MKQVWRWLLGEPNEAQQRPDSAVPHEARPGPSTEHPCDEGSLTCGAPAASGSLAAPNVARAVEPSESDAGPVVRALQSAATSSAALAAVAERLVPALDGLPELVHHQSRATEAILQLTGQARDRDALLAKALTEFEQGADRQTQLLRLIQQQLDLNHVTNTSVAEGLRDASIALGAYAGTSERHTRAIESLLEATRRRTRKADQMERSLQTWMIVTTGLATACLAYSLFLAYRSTATTASERPAESVVADSAAEGPGASSQVGLGESEEQADGTVAPGASIEGTDSTATPSEIGRDKSPTAPATPTSTVIPLP